MQKYFIPFLNADRRRHEGDRDWRSRRDSWSDRILIDRLEIAGTLFVINVIRKIDKWTQSKIFDERRGATANRQVYATSVYYEKRYERIAWVAYSAVLPLSHAHKKSLSSFEFGVSAHAEGTRRDLWA